MNKEQFLQLISEIKEQIDDIEVRREYLENKFFHYGYSVKSGYKVVTHFYNELRKARDGQPTVFTGKIVHNEIDKTFGLVTNYACVFKMTYSGFDRLKTLFDKSPQQTEAASQYKQSISVNYLAKIEDSERLGCKVDDPVSYIPEPTNMDEMFERLHKLHGQHVCESRQRNFSEIYGDGNYKIISDQLDKLNEFVGDAESLSTVDTFIDPISSISMNRIWMIISKRVKERTNNDENLKLQNDNYLKQLIEYSRLKYGYYEKKNFISSYVTFFSSIAAEVYGKYFLYKQWLEDKMDEFKKVLPAQQTKSNSFIQLLITGIKELQERGVKEPFIFNLKNSNEKDESGFRDWFSEFFQRHGFIAHAERKKEKGRIDLIVKHDDFGEKKIEFKIWYNPDKKEILNQIYSYLTDFNNEGYIFMINDMKSQIIEEYKSIVTQNQKNKWNGTWDILNNDGYEYFKSGHNIGANPKTIYHFNFNIYS